MSERTLVLIKPDGVRRGLIGDVIARIERKGLTIAAMELRQLDADTAKTHYAEHSERPFFGELVDFITSAPLVALVVEGPRAVEAFPRPGRADRPGEVGPRHHPRRPRPGDRRERRARLRLSRVRRAGDQDLLPRPVLENPPESPGHAGAFLRFRRVKARDQRIYVIGVGSVCSALGTTRYDSSAMRYSR